MAIDLSLVTYSLVRNTYPKLISISNAALAILFKRVADIQPQESGCSRFHRGQDTENWQTAGFKAKYC
ncbi:hypothetical protein HanIR_Chr09g0391851 [Helianthus annuus]|nr:hypothetical protein HanIR_Chr09g0391851 [Helianthus annuus]